MKKRDALAALAALAQENRLDVFRLLVEAGPQGLPAGSVAEKLKLAPNNLTFHFDRLREAGLVTVRRDGRSMIYAARFDRMNALLGYLTENCCRGHAEQCAPSECSTGTKTPSRDGARVMRLYLFEHCSLCFRVRMTAALKRLHLHETVVLDDDTETMVGLVGKRQVPILIRDDGQPMLESMDMVRYVNSLGAPVLTGPERNEVAGWADRFAAKAAPLTWPRYPLLGLPEFATDRGARPLHRPQAQGDRRPGRAARRDAPLPRRACAGARRIERADRAAGCRQWGAVARRRPGAAAAALGRGGQGSFASPAGSATTSRP